MAVPGLKSKRSKSKPDEATSSTITYGAVGNAQKNFEHRTTQHQVSRLAQSPDSSCMLHNVARAPALLILHATQAANLPDHEHDRRHRREQVRARLREVQSIKPVQGRGDMGDQIGQEQDERDEEEDLARKREEDRLRGLAGRLEVVRGHDLEADDRQRDELHAHRERGELVEVVVDDAERAHDGGREQVDDRPHQNADGGGPDDAALVRAAHARNQARAVVVTQKRLDGRRHADDGEHGELRDALHDADRSERVLRPDDGHSPVLHQLIVQYEIDDGHARLHGEARKSQREDGAHEPRIGLHATQAQMHGGVLHADEVPQHRNAGKRLAGQRRQRAADDAPPEQDDEEVVENRRAHQTDDHRHQSADRGARRADEVVHAHADHLEDEAEAENLNVDARVGTYVLGRARHGENPVENERIGRR